MIKVWKSNFDSKRIEQTVRLRNRSGFTLIEVLLSLALTVVLLLALYSVFDLYQRVTISGRVDVERAQIARALMRMVELDLRSCTFQPSEEEEAAVSEEEDTEATVVEISTPEEALSGTATGIVGDAYSIVIYTSRPARSTSSSGGTTRLSDMRSVSYFLADPSADGLQGTVGQQVAGQSSTIDSSGIQGLARLDGDQLSMQLADSQSDTESLADSSELLAPEINYLQFQYFDGIEWLEEWDSSAMGSLPLAVEIVVGFRPADNVIQQETSSASSEMASDLHRYVVSLPLAEPAILIQQGYAE